MWEKKIVSRGAPWLSWMRNLASVRKIQAMEKLRVKEIRNFLRRDKSWERQWSWNQVLCSFSHRWWSETWNRSRKWIWRSYRRRRRWNRWPIWCQSSNSKTCVTWKSIWPKWCGSSHTLFSGTLELMSWKQVWGFPAEDVGTEDKDMPSDERRDGFNDDGQARWRRTNSVLDQ